MSVVYRPKIGSLFSGAGGFDLGFEAAGFEVAWQVEIDRDCVSVLARHWPTTRRLGDVREVDPERDLTPVDVVVFGSPCQGFSVAGKRRGLADERSGLFGEAVRIIRGLRPGPALVLWENVPGSFTTGERDPDDPERDVRGRDFAAVLAALANLGALDIAWRVLDSQGVGDCVLHRVRSGFWAVPQRRRRIFLVADFGAERAVEILALADGVSRHPAPRRNARQGAPGAPHGDAPSRSVPDVAFTLRGNDNGTGASDNGWNTTYIACDVADTLSVGANQTTGFQGDVVALEAPAVSVPLTAGMQTAHHNGQDDHANLLIPVMAAGHEGSGGAGIGAPGSPMFTLDTTGAQAVAMTLTAGSHPDSNAPGRHREDDENLIAVPISSDAASGRSGDALTPSADAEGKVRLRPPSAGVGDADDPSFTVNAGAAPAVAVAFNWQAGGGNDESFRGKGRQYIVRAGDYTGEFGASKHDAVFYSLYPRGATEAAVSQAVTANHGTSQNRRGTHVVEPEPGGWIVRRLMPVEGERLQGWPDRWTAYRADGSEIADGPRYRMIGNGVSATVAYWLACRMRAVLEPTS